MRWFPRRMAGSKRLPPKTNGWFQSRPLGRMARLVPKRTPETNGWAGSKALPGSGPYTGHRGVVFNSWMLRGVGTPKHTKHTKKHTKTYQSTQKQPLLRNVPGRGRSRMPPGSRWLGTPFSPAQGEAISFFLWWYVVYMWEAGEEMCEAEWGNGTWDPRGVFNFFFFGIKIKRRC